MPPTNELEHLVRRIRGCTICEGLPLGPKPLLQCSSIARILIAGQAPGRLTHESGIPFDDRSGDRLRDWMGIDRGTFYDPAQIAIIPMGFCYPGTGKRGDLPPRPECAKNWREPLLALLTQTRLCILVGMYAQRWHLQDKNKKTLSETVASWREYYPDVIPTPHPSPRNAMWLSKNPRFEKELLPRLKQRVQDILKAY